MTNARELTNRLADLLRREQHAMADFLVALADFDRKRLWLELGHTSLFYFLHRELGLSKGAAHYRKTAAELIQRFPEMVEPLRDGRLCITSIVPLAKVLTPENRSEMLPRFFHRSRREAMEVAAAVQPRLAPRRDVVTAVRVSAPADVVSAPATSARAAVQPVEPALDPAQVMVQPVELPLTTTAEPAPPPRSAARDSVEPLTANLSRLHVTVSRRFLDKLDAARDALSHSNPGATMEEILEAGLDLLLERAAKRKGIVEKPRKEPPPSSPHSDHIPAHVRRAVWLRDGGRCQWRMDDGSVCGSTFQVEFDHVHPQALGGPSTVENVRVACRPHNQLAARRVFGGPWMDRFTRMRDAAPWSLPAREIPTPNVKTTTR